MKKKAKKRYPRKYQLVLSDHADPSCRKKQKSLPVKVELCPQGITVYPKGYGDATSADGYGSPILIEFYSGELRVVLWSDINREDPTHTISMEEARESNRQFCPKCGQRWENHNSDGSCIKG